MNARDAMQALLDGKTLCNGNSNHYKLDSDGYIISKGDISAGNWYSTDILCMNGVVDEYPLTFKQALRAMLDGKVVMNDCTCGMFRFNDGFEVGKNLTSDEGKWFPVVIYRNEQKAKWKVVE